MRDRQITTSEAGNTIKYCYLLFVIRQRSIRLASKIVEGKLGAIASFDVCLLLSALMRLKLHQRQSLPTSEYLIVMYIHTTKAASLLEISSRRLRQLLQQGRVKGAYKSGKFWLIPLYNGLPQITKAKRGQAGTWKMRKKPTKTIVHINSNTIKQNIKKERAHREPVIAIKGAKKSYVHQLEIPAPCRIVYEPDKPLSCGARVWIEVLNWDLELIAS